MEDKMTLSDIAEAISSLESLADLAIEIHQEDEEALEVINEDIHKVRKVIEFARKHSKETQKSFHVSELSDDDFNLIMNAEAPAENENLNELTETITDQSYNTFIEDIVKSLEIDKCYKVDHEYLLYRENHLLHPGYLTQIVHDIFNEMNEQTSKIIKDRSFFNVLLDIGEEACRKSTESRNHD